MQRTVMLADMNCFFASVHQALDPNLRGKPVIVAGDPKKRHGIVLAKSYECKQYATITTGMFNREAKALIPHAVFIEPRHDLYVKFSARIHEILQTFTPLVEPFSIDEFFLDVTGSTTLFGSPAEIAEKIQRKLWTQVKIPSSIGIGANKLCAKQAAEFKKPMGISTLWPHEVQDKLWPLPVRELFGIGRRLEKRLYLWGVKTIGDLAQFDTRILKNKFGIVGLYLWRSANGLDDGPVDPHALDTAKSIGHQITLPRDYLDADEINTALFDICEMVGTRVRAGNYTGRTVSVHVRDTSLYFFRWSRSLRQPTDLTEEIYQAAAAILKENWSQWRPIRLLGVSLGNLARKHFTQTECFSQREKLAAVNAAIDTLRSTYGKKCIVRGRSMLPGGIYLAGWADWLSTT